MTRLAAILLTIFALYLTGCGPQLQVPKAPSALVEAERQQQLDMAFQRDIEHRVRLFRVYSKIRTNGAELCGKYVKPFAGLFLADLNSFAPEVRDRAARVLKLNNEIRVIAAGPPASDAGIKDGDTIRKVAGIVLEPRSFIQSSSEIESATKILDRAGLNPVEIEVKRLEGNVTATVIPKLACQYRVILENSDAVNAAADGNQIIINTGMLRFAATDDELALVVGHELAHNALGHLSRQRANESVGMVLGALLDLGLLAGAGISTQGAATRAGGQAGRRAFSQAFEAEADYLGLYFAARAGFDVSKAPDLWRRMAVEHPGAIREKYLATHPSTPERAANLQQALHEVAGKFLRNEPLLPISIEAPAVQKPVATIDTQDVLKQQTKLEKDRRAPEATRSPQQDIPQKKPEPVKRYATLQHTKGPTRTIPPQTLQAEYVDTGDGHGSARVIYPGNYVLDGEYRTIASGQSFKGLVNARLIDPDQVINFPNSSLRGFASFSGADGTILECVYAVTGPSGNGLGNCVDNRGNQYKLSF